MLRKLPFRTRALEWLKDHGLLRDLHDLHHRLFVHVRAIDHDARLLAGAHELGAEGRQGGARLVAPAGSLVGAVVGEQHLPNAQLGVEGNRRRVGQERLRALQVEADRELVLLRRRAHILDGASREEIGAACDLLAKGRDHGDDVSNRRHVHADIDRDEVEARVPVPLQGGEIVVRLERHAAMGIPANIHHAIAAAERPPLPSSM